MTKLISPMSWISVTADSSEPEIPALLHNFLSRTYAQLNQKLKIKIS